MNQDLYLHGLIGNTNSNPSTPAPTPWERPADWLVVPDLVNGTHKIYMLLSIVEETDNNFATLDCSGEYTVDWGDGTAPQTVTGAATHTYDWTDLSVGTLTSLGHRQTLVVATATTAFTSININQTLTNGKIQELKINAPACTSLTITDNPEHIFIGQNAVPTWDSKFSNYQKLKCISIAETLNTCTNFNGMFSNCDALTTIPLLDTSSGTNFSYMFNGCYALKILGMTNIPNVSFSIAESFLDRDEIISIFNELATGSETITLFSASFALLSGPDIAIATGKGWTVVS